MQKEKDGRAELVSMLHGLYLSPWSWDSVPRNRRGWEEGGMSRRETGGQV